MIGIYLGCAQQALYEKRRKEDKATDDDMRERLSSGGASAIEIEMAILRAREVRALERRRVN